jgi:hypothetical protein
MGRFVKVIAVGAASASMAAAASAQERVVIVGRRDCCAYTMSFDSFANSYFGSANSYSTGFDVPESEAFMLGWNIFKNQTPSPVIKTDVCNAGGLKLTAQTLSITRNSEDLERLAAANQIYYDNLPNFINRRKDGLLLDVTFSDGSYEQYRHTTMYGMRAVSGTYKPGTGVSKCHG